MNMRKVKKNDYIEHIKVLSQLTNMKTNQITKEKYNEFIDKLNDSHLIYIIEYKLWEQEHYLLKIN